MSPVVQSLLWMAAAFLMIGALVASFVRLYPAALDRLTPADMDDEMGTPAPLSSPVETSETLPEVSPEWLRPQSAHK